MKRFLSIAAVVMTWFVLLGSSHWALASHILGGDLTYTRLSGNLYRVKFRFYRDCSGDQVSSFKLNYRNTGCNSTSNQVNMSVLVATVNGSPYCAGSSSNNCSSSNPNPNYDVTTYYADVTLAPGQWTLFVNPRDKSRPNIANLTNLHGVAFNCTTADSYLYVEATLDNRVDAAGNAVVNNSPQFDPQDFVVQYVGLNQRSTITYSSIETDGDSLAYEMVQPLDDCGLPVPYAPYTGGGNTGGTVALPNGCRLTLPPAFANFTTDVPLPVALDTLGTCPNRTARPAFYFNAAARTVTFTPNRYVSTGTVNCGYNKYQLVVKISEYRRINGVRRLVGTVRREGVVIVLNTSNNVPTPPTASNQTPNSGAILINKPDTLQVSVYACSYARVRINFTDPDPGQPLTVTYPSDINTNAAYLNNGSVGTFSLVGNNTTAPVGTFIFQPSPAAVGSTIRINFRAEDNACPVKGVQNRVLVIRVLRGNFARITPTTANGVALAGTPTVTVCSGAVNLTSTVIRPDSVRNPGGGTVGAQQYSYAWTVRGNGLNPAQASSRTLTVTPTVSSRYLLTVTPLNGFASGCGDTTSVLVRVVPPPTVAVVATPAVACASSAVTLRAVVTRPDAFQDSYAYAWSGPGVAAGTSGPSITVNPNANATTYTVVATSLSGSACTSSGTATVRQAPAPVVAFRTDSASAGGAQFLAPVTYTFTNTSTIGGGFALDSVRWTYQRTKDGHGQAVSETPVVFSRRTQPAPLKLAISGEYIIRLSTNTTAAGTPCPGTTASYRVLVPYHDLPNIITPNGDGLNDRFVVRGEQVGAHLQVFNRWGRLVKDYASYQNDWGGEELPAGTYFYAIKEANGTLNKGWIEIVR